MSNLNVNNITPLAGTSGTVSISGSLHIRENLSANGTLTLGDANTDSIALNTEFTSSLIPDLDDIFDIGSSTKEWKDLYIDGTGYIDTLDNVNTTHITASGNISSSGTGSFTGGGIFGGNVGIGTTDPQKKLDIANGDIRLDNNKSIFFATTDGNVGRVAITGDESGDFIQLKVDNNNSHLLRLNTTGVGIGTTSPGEKLEVVGNISASGTITGNSIVGTIGTATQGTIDHDSLANFTSNEHFTQGNITTVGTVTSGNVTAILPSGILSSSVAGTLSSSAQIATEISGAFTAASSSLASRITTAESELGNTLFSGSSQVDHDATTNFVAAEHVDWAGASAGTVHATNYTNTTYAVGELTPAGTYSSSLQTLTNITASGDISASGTVTMLTASIGGGTFTSASLAAGGSGGGSWVGTATSDLNMDSNDIYGIQHITASGNISSSGNIEANNLYLHPESGKVYFTADENEYIAGNSTYLELNAGGGMYFKIGGAHKFAYRNSKFGIGDFGTSNPAEKLTVEGNISSSGFISTLSHITASGNISSSGTIIATPQLQYNTSSISSTGNVQGDIIKFGNSTTVAGAIYAHTGSGWSLAHSGSNGAASSSLGLAVGTNSTTHGMLLRGMANIGYDPGGDNGCALYLESPGSASSTVPSTTGHVSRVVGWNYGSDTVYFNPDNTWVLLA